MMKMTLGIPMMSEGQGAIKNGVKHKITIKILLMVLLTFILYLRWFSIIILSDSNSLLYDILKELQILDFYDITKS